MALLLLATIGALALRSWVQRLLVADGMDVVTAGNLSYLVVPPILAVMLYPVWKREGHAVMHSLRPSALGWQLVLTAVVLGIALRFASWGHLIAQAGFGSLSAAQPDDAVLIGFNCPSAQFVALHLLVMVCLIPVIEEIIYRSCIFRWMLPYGAFFAMVVSALLFAAMHQTEGMFMAFLFGLYAARFYLNSGAIWGPLIAHCVYNGLIIVDWYCLDVIWTPSTIDNVTRAVGALGLSLALVSLTLGALLVSRRVTGPPAR